MKITVITVCYNSAKTIERTIRSVMAQDYDDLEYIIIDGGSTDGTIDIIEKYKNGISLCVSEPDHGLYDAMNKGLQRMTGDVFAFLNSDDYYADNVLKRVKYFFEANDVDIVSGNMYICRDKMTERAVYDKSSVENMFFDVVYPHPALFAKRGLYMKYGGFNTSYRIAADSDWVMKVCLDGASVLCVEDYFTYFSDGGISSRNKYVTLEEQYRVVLKYTRLGKFAHLRKAVDDYYSAEFKKMEMVERRKNNFEKRIGDIKKLFDYDKKYYIWGAGNRGMECMKVFEKLGLHIAGFIDSYKNTGVVNGYLMIRPEDIDRRNSICITPDGYEKEIISNLEGMGLGDMEYFTYTGVRDQIARLIAVEQ